MKPIENIFGFDCATCEHNRHCYGGNMGNQFRYCQKSAEKIQNLDNLEKQNKQLKDNWNKLKEYLRDFDIEYLNEIMEHNLANTLENILSKMQELEQGVSDAKD